MFDKLHDVVLQKKENVAPKEDGTGYEKSGKCVNKYIGLLKCGECGAGMARRYNKNLRNGVQYYRYYYLCQNYLTVSRKLYQGNRWQEEVLDQLVYHALKNQMKQAEKLKEHVVQFHDQYYKPYLKILEKERIKILQLLEKNEAARLMLYEEFASGTASRDSYQSQSARMDDIKVQFQKRLGEIAVHEEKMKKLSKDNLKWLIDFIEGESIEELTLEVVHSYIEEIRLYGDKRIEIVFKFQDEMQKN